jgi:hypothetical protein
MYIYPTDKEEKLVEKEEARDAALDIQEKALRIAFDWAEKEMSKTEKEDPSDPNDIKWIRWEAIYEVHRSIEKDLWQLFKERQNISFERKGFAAW